MSLALPPPPFIREVTIACAWDNSISTRSNPLTDLTEAAAAVQRAARIEIPMRIWAVILRHTQVQREYHALAFTDPDKPQHCLTCGALRATFRPVLDRNTFERLLHASPDGPVLPGSIIITESSENAVLVRGRDVSLAVQITTPLHRSAGVAL